MFSNNQHLKWFCTLQKNGMKWLEYSDTQTHGHKPSLSVCMLESFSFHWRGRKVAWSWALLLTDRTHPAWHPASGLVRGRSCFLLSISGHLISHTTHSFPCKFNNYREGEKLTENILPDGENWNITLVSLPAQIHSDRLEMIYCWGGMEEESMGKREHTYTSREIINCYTMLRSLHCFACN